MKDYYRILDLPADASSDAVKERYRLLVRIFHPDRYPKLEDKAYAEQRLQEINEAYETIQGKRGRGLALAADSRPPRPVVAPGQIDFGPVRHGERAQAQIRIDNTGGFAQALNFRYEEGVEWITVAKGERVDPDRPLPMMLTLEASTSALTNDKRYESWLEIDMNGATMRVPLSIQVNSQAESGRGMTWLLAATMTFILIILFYLGWQWLGSGLEPSTTIALGTVDAVALPVDTSPVDTSPADTVAESDDSTLLAGVGFEEPSASFPDSSTDSASSEQPPLDVTPMVAAKILVAEVQATEPLEPTATPPSATATSAPTTTPTSEPSATLTPTESATDTPTVFPTPEPVQTATPAPLQLYDPGLNSAVVLTVPQTFDVNARADTSVDSTSLAVLPKGTTYRGIARTIDNAWTQIVLADGRAAWVFTETMEADVEQVATLPVSLALLDVAAIADRPQLNVTVDPANVASQTAEDADVVPVTGEPATGQQTHLVQPGEYLKQLAIVYYGDERFWEEIYEANAAIIGSDPNQLEAGMELIIPDR